jgi:hypothetical protein
MVQDFQVGTGFPGGPEIPSIDVFILQPILLLASVGLFRQLTFGGRSAAAFGVAWAGQEPRAARIENVLIGTEKTI